MHHAVIRRALVLTCLIALAGSCGGQSASTPVLLSEDTALRAELEQALAEAIAAAGKTHAVAAVPTGERSQVSDLSVTQEPSTVVIATFRWSYRNSGDYNQDGLVTINDLTPLGLHYGTLRDVDWPGRGADTTRDGVVNFMDLTPIGQHYGEVVEPGSPEDLKAADADGNGEIGAGDIAFVEAHAGEMSPELSWQVAEIADGDENDEVGLSDITPIGQNWQGRVGGYELQYAASAGPGAQWTVVAQLALAEAAAPSWPGGRLRFGHGERDADDGFYRVTPFLDDGEARTYGIPSDPVEFTAQ